MTIHAWPSLGKATPANMDWTLKFNTMPFTSLLTGSVQTIEFPGARWIASFSLQNLIDADAAKMQSFLAKLRGRSGRFYMHNFARPLPRGSLRGNPLVKGAGQTGNTLLVDGATVGGTLLEGDYFGVNDEVKIVTEDCTVNGSGEVTITFEPPLRNSPADNASLTLDRPKAIFMFGSDEAKWSTALPLLTDIPFSCIEVWE